QTAMMEISPSEKWKNKFILVKPGETLMLPCFYKDEDNYKISWFKQPLEEKPRLVCVGYGSSWACYESFANNPRFRLDTNNNGAHLTITDLEFSDSASYYCVNQNNYDYIFTEGYKVIVEGSELAITQSPSELAITQSPSEFIHSVGTGTPNCRVHTGTCDGEHTVYWFRDSGPSELSLVYSHKGRNNQCEKETNTCFYSLSLKNLNISQTGTYYCAVAACGRILFGGGATLECEDNGNLVWVCFLSAGWIFTTVLVVFLCIFIFMTKKKNTDSLDLDSQPRSPVASTANTDSQQEEDKLHYATVRVKQPNTLRKQRNSQQECVYSSVRQ
uniref:Ig-like domain-containing protein n=1 Tax=Tetraodon nigroviridis TaxID=99883 RepID=H3C4P5_TETNG